MELTPTQSTISEGRSFQSPRTVPMLPPEKWADIFQNFTPMDFLSVINSCPEWNELLADKKTTCLLPFVLPKLMDYLGKDSLLQLRKVNTTTQTFIDQTLQNHSTSASDDDPFGLHHEESLRHLHFRRTIQKIDKNFSFTFRNVEELLIKFLLEQPSPLNPFLTRNISISVGAPSPVQPPQDFQSILHLLNRFGHHLLSVKFTIWGEANYTQCFSDLATCLHSLPNLRSLTVTGSLWLTTNACDIEPELDLSYNFPALPHLLHLDVKAVGNDADSHSFSFILSLLHRYGQQLTSFACSGSFLSLPNLTVDLLNSLLPNVKKFRIKSMHSAGLSKLSQVSWSLEQIRMEGTSIVHSRNVLKAVNSFHVSLEHLQIDCRLPIPHNSCVNHNRDDRELLEFENMSKLKVIITKDVNMSRKLFTTFLEGSCEQLKNLHFHTNKRELEEDDEDMVSRLFRRGKNLQKVFFWLDYDTAEPTKRVLSRWGSNPNI